jgi:acetolactate synthase-1/2/3 large subunit
VHIDIDPQTFKNVKRSTIPIQADIRKFLQIFNENLPCMKDYRGWVSKIQEYKDKYPGYCITDKPEIDPNYFFHILSQMIDPDAIICVDVGQIQMWAAQSLELAKDQRFLTEGGMASIGSALPLGIGASFAKPGKQVVVIVGDGGFQLNIQELQTVYHHQLPIKIILLNNYGYGMIKQFQEQYMDSRFQSSGIGYSQPDFQEVVQAYKIPALKITRMSEVVTALDTVLCGDTPAFLEVVIDPSARASPKLAVNKPIEDQEPLLDREELMSNMIVDMLSE